MGGFLCLFLARKEKNPLGGLNSSQCEVIFTNTLPPWRRRKLTLVGTCLADTAACRAAHGRSGVRGRGGSGEPGLKESGPAERQSSRCGKTGGLPARESPCLSAPVGLS